MKVIMFVQLVRETDNVQFETEKVGNSEHSKKVVLIIKELIISLNG